MNDIDYFNLAAVEARKSLCSRGHCGAVVVKNNEVIGCGFNSPPQNNSAHRMCHLNQRVSRKPKSDRTCCLHAEWRALIDAVRTNGDITGASLYFVRVDKAGEIVPSGEPYCTVCSRLALDLGLRYFGLLHTHGPTLYETADYNRRSYSYHDILPNKSNDEAILLV